MKAKFLRLLILSSFVLVGCDNPFNKADKNAEDPGEQQPSGEGQQGGGGQQGGEGGGQQGGDSETYFSANINVKMEALLKGSETPYTVQIKYDDTYFEGSANEYNKDLSLISFGSAVSATYEDWSKDFFAQCKFENVTTHQMDIEPTSETLGYTLAHKKYKESEVFAVAIRGHEYKQEWANNFIIGKEGDHNGWLARTTELYDALDSYITEHKAGRTVKLWVVGYSRAGAIANMLASMISRGENIKCENENMYVYTFEAPAGLIEDHAIKYDNVHNIVNSADIVTYIPPTQYELFRCGKDVEIYDFNFGQYITAFDNEITVPEFTALDPSDYNGATISDDAELTEFIINDVFKDKEDDTISAHTRELYVENYQAGLSYSIGMMLSLSSQTRSSMLSDLTGNLWTALTILGDETGNELANFMETYLQRDNIQYDFNELKDACAVLIKAINNLFTRVLSLFMSDKDHLTRILDMHYPEVTYCLLNNAHSKMEA